MSMGGKYLDREEKDDDWNISSHFLSDIIYDSLTHLFDTNKENLRRVIELIINEQFDLFGIKKKGISIFG